MKPQKQVKSSYRKGQFGCSVVAAAVAFTLYFAANLYEATIEIQNKRHELFKSTSCQG